MNNKVMRLYVSVLYIPSTEVVLLLKSGGNEVCPTTNYGRPKTLFSLAEVCLSTGYDRPKTSFPPDFSNRITSAESRKKIKKKVQSSKFCLSLPRKYFENMTRNSMIGQAGSHPAEVAGTSGRKSAPRGEDAAKTVREKQSCLTLQTIAGKAKHAGNMLSAIAETANPAGNMLSAIAETANPAGNILSAIAETANPAGNILSAIAETAKHAGNMLSAIAETANPAGNVLSAIAETAKTVHNNYKLN
jgi:hypothetical protein